MGRNGPGDVPGPAACRHPWLRACRNERQRSAWRNWSEGALKMRSRQETTGTNHSAGLCCAFCGVGLGLPNAPPPHSVTQMHLPLAFLPWSWVASRPASQCATPSGPLPLPSAHYEPCTPHVCHIRTSFHCCLLLGSDGLTEQVVAAAVVGLKPAWSLPLHPPT